MNEGKNKMGREIMYGLRWGIKDGFTSWTTFSSKQDALDRISELIDNYGCELDLKVEVFRR